MSINVMASLAIRGTSVKVEKRMKTVLFVCVHNSGCSQMAEALFNLLVKGRALAYSAGTQPADRVNSVVAEAMREVGIDISGNKPKALTMDMVKKADRMITMGCGAEAGAVCPASFVKTEDWALEDLKGKSLERVRKIRDEIKERVTGLLNELK
jgi:arsenate reductase